MIVHSYDEAKPILTAEIAKGKKLGHIAMSGVYHDGYKSCYKMARKLSDYVVCLYSNLTWLNSWGELWGKLSSPLGTNRSLELNIAREVEKDVDLVVMGDPPPPPTSLEELSEIKLFTIQNYVLFNQVNDPSYNFSVKEHCWRTGYFTAAYYFNRNYFEFPIRVKSYKDGLWRFIQEQTFPSLGCNLVVIPPERDEHGLAVGNTNSMFAKYLKDITKGKQLIASKDETKESLKKKLLPAGILVEKFEKYEGKLLNKHKNEGSAFIFVSLKNPRTGGSYTDGFIV